ncbi:hypothetical protein T03_4488 [Trichinella britovi]|uniref:Uncharacterized protein n=1 Tax=Trichinella britovi TaxID=45882 RepID=A0A0V0YQ50_TRIBR|nr:hypothetical protein T03_4488 [Trichinella britovi]
MRQIPSADNAADMFTKALTPSRLAAWMLEITPSSPYT